MPAEDGKIEAGHAIEILAEQDSAPPSATDLLLAKLVEQSAQTAAVLAQVSERLEALETRGAGTLARPDDVPEPDGIDYPFWEDMDNTQRAAWIRAHEGTAPPPPPASESEMLQLGDGLYAEFPVPPPEVRDEWAKFAPELFENWPRDASVSMGDAIAAYSKGGPLWLAAYGSKAHAWLMELPKSWRQEMVWQVTHYAPVEGAALGRDILKAKTDEAKDHAYQENLGWADDRKAGVVARPGPGDAVQRD